MGTFYIVLLTIAIYSIIGTVCFLASNEKEEVAAWFGIGVIGMLIFSTTKLIRSIKRLNLNSKTKTLLKSPSGTVWCENYDANDIYGWIEGYDLVKRYATKNEWHNIPKISNETVLNSKRNCDHCIHDVKECHGLDLNDALCKGDKTYPMFQKGK